jgi:hypothetical protein
MQRLSWNVQAKTRRTTGQRYFTGVNARRLRDGQELLALPPGLAPFPEAKLFKRLIIHNKHGRITLELELSRVPRAPVTVWASRPVKHSHSTCHKCPRLGPLPPLKKPVTDFTQRYFQKHGEYISRHRVQMAGMRIFVRIRQELDEQPGPFEGASQVVPPAAEPGWPSKTS